MGTGHLRLNTAHEQENELKFNKWHDIKHNLHVKIFKE
jgi:hypothetical protein